MRNYLYIWHKKEQQFIVASGIEFADISGYISLSSGLILLSHCFDDAKFDKNSRFDFIGQKGIRELSNEDIYSWGDFCWVDYDSESFPKISKKEIAELLYFSHMAEPFKSIIYPSLKNKFLFYSHDDSWFLKLYYKNWNDINDLISALNISCDKDKLINSLISQRHALWVQGDSIEEEESTFDIDSIINKRLKAPTTIRKGVTH
jgi:hypothetical protein